MHPTKLPYNDDSVRPGKLPLKKPNTKAHINMHSTERPHNDDSHGSRKPPPKKPNTKAQINESLGLLGFLSWYDLEPGMPIRYNSLAYEKG